MLVAIAIPVFTSQLEKAREATDASNIRAAYAEIAAAALTDPDTDHSATIEKKQKVDDWQNTGIEDIAGVVITDIKSTADTEISYDSSTGKFTIDGKDVITSFVDEAGEGDNP